MDLVNFPKALQHLLDGGESLKREGWNGKGMVVRKHVPSYGVEPHLIIYSSITGKANSWVPSSPDLLAEDWVTIGESPNVVQEVEVNYKCSKEHDKFWDTYVYLVSTEYEGVNYWCKSKDSFEKALLNVINQIEKAHGVKLKYPNDMPV